MNSSPAVIVILLIILIAIIAIAFLVSRKRRSQKLRERFGPEYDRVVRQEGDVRTGESVLEFRARQRERFTLRPLSPQDRSAFETRWNEVQSQFVDDPKGSVTLADGLVTELMTAEGYPMGDFEQRAADISVDHPVVVENYRGARAVALRHKRGEASTEDLRKAMVYYRALFEELLDGHQSRRKGA